LTAKDGGVDLAVFFRQLNKLNASVPASATHLLLIDFATRLNLCNAGDLALEMWRLIKATKS